MTLSSYPISVYTVLQHISTALGMAIVAFWVGNCPGLPRQRSFPR